MCRASFGFHWKLLNFWSNNRPNNQGLGKVASMGKILGWPLTSVSGGMACMSDSCGLPCEYGDPQTLSGLMGMFEEQQELWQRRAMKTYPIFPCHLWCPTCSNGVLRDTVLFRLGASRAPGMGLLPNEGCWRQLEAHVELTHWSPRNHQKLTALVDMGAKCTLIHGTVLMPFP